MMGDVSEATDARGATPLDGRRVLVVDDDDTLREIVCAYVSAAGATVDQAADSVTALRLAEASPPDVVVLDRMIPGVNGIEVARRLRMMGSVPIVMLTALGETEHRIEGLEAGVDDYLAKPFSPRELVLRIASVLRRRDGTNAPHDVVLGRLRLDAASTAISLDGAPLALTGREYELLAYLMRRPGRTISREALRDEVWGWSVGDASTVTVHVRRLREKLEVDPGEPRILLTVWGVGYRLDPTALAAADAPAAPGSAFVENGARDPEALP
jgi:DNA-binding response OmpR family regulator